MLPTLQYIQLERLGQVKRLHHVGIRLHDSDQFLAILCSEMKLPASVENSVRKRKIEYLAGRRCVDKVLSDHFSIENFHVKSGEDRGPVWPHGIVGSITHTADLATCILGHSRDYRGVGIDAEKLISEKMFCEIKDQVFNRNEQEIIGSNMQSATLLFCFKEAYYKCFAPLVGKFFGFDTIEVTHFDFAEMSIEYKLRSNIQTLRDNPNLEISFHFEDGVALCIVALEKNN